MAGFFMPGFAPDLHFFDLFLVTSFCSSINIVVSLTCTFRLIIQQLSCYVLRCLCKILHVAIRRIKPPTTLFYQDLQYKTGKDAMKSHSYK
jgi:hypothetical protein